MDKDHNTLRRISPPSDISYGRIAAEEFIIHRSQGGARVEQALLEHGEEGLERPIPLLKPSRFILGKSLVSAGTTEDVFAGIVPLGIPYHRSPGFTPRREAAPSMELGGPWGFYRQFWQAHGLEHLARLIPDEVTVQVGGTLNIPLVIGNPTDSAVNASLKIDCPAQWRLLETAPSVTIEPHSRYFIRLQAAAPATKLAGWQQFRVSAGAAGTSLGNVSLRVELANWALPQ